jgi:hypothetical protein
MFAQRSHAVAEAMDKINDKYGEFVITPALMMGMDETILDSLVKTPSPVRAQQGIMGSN